MNVCFSSGFFAREALAAVGFTGSEKGGMSIDLDAVMEAASDNQVIKLLNLVLLQAIKDNLENPVSMLA